MSKENFNIEIEHKNVPFVLVKFTNKIDGIVSRSRFDLANKIFIDPVPVPPDTDLRNNIVTMYNDSRLTNENLWIVSVCKTGFGWQTPIIFRESEKEKMNELILNEQLARNTVTTSVIREAAIEPLRQFFKDEAIAESLKSKPEIITFDCNPRHVVDVIFDPPTFPAMKDK